MIDTNDIVDKIKEHKDIKHITNQQIADKEGIPVSTVNRILAKQTTDPQFSTMCSIIYGAGCLVDELTGKAQKPETEVIQVVPETTKELIGQLKDTIKEKNKWLYLLFGVLSVVLLTVLLILVYDITHPDIGYLRFKQ